MKLFLLLTLFYLISVDSSGQSFEGEWKGRFETNFYKFPYEKSSSPIKLYFKLNSDSSYSVYSYSKGFKAKMKDTTVVCQVEYKLVGQDSIYLEEVKVMEPQNAIYLCLQKMKLKITEKTNKIILEGNWSSDSEECKEYGTIIFRKKKKTK